MIVANLRHATLTAAYVFHVEHCTDSNVSQV